MPAAVALAGLVAALSMGQAGAPAVIVNSGEAKWTRGPGDPPGGESVVLRDDLPNGGLELLVRYPAGHVFAPHWHDSNERILLLEGRLSLVQGGGVKVLEPGGYAYLPAREVQRLSCVSQTRCEFYVAWDGKPASHAASAAR
jgi:quercetin dioxygenase-like cupin family protein